VGYQDEIFSFYHPAHKPEKCSPIQQSSLSVHSSLSRIPALMMLKRSLSRQMRRDLHLRSSLLTKLRHSILLLYLSQLSTFASLESAFVGRLSAFERLVSFSLVPEFRFRMFNLLDRSPELTLDLRLRLPEPISRLALGVSNSR
jgi:hypothetical protein